MCLLDCGAWMSTLGLLHPLEYFVTVNQSALWQKHVAWAKPQGQELRNYITARYSTNMVLLSLMLGAEISVLFNSSKELVELRAILTDMQNLFTLKFWIGVILLLDVYVTLMGLVATYTLWGMISAVSDRNSHSLLRSSIGQYVISLPPRLVVASLYLFLLWSMMYVVVELVASPLCWIVVGLILLLFFSIIIPLSAFGRLILHTGAMAQKPVLREDLEQDLLPCGLQAYLLLRATSRQRQNLGVTAEYRRRQQNSAIAEVNTHSSSFNVNRKSIDNGIGASKEPIAEESTQSSRQKMSQSREIKHNNMEALSNQVDLLSHSSTSSPSPITRGHNRFDSMDSIMFDVPQASILNSMTSQRKLHDLIESTLQQRNEQPEEAPVISDNANNGLPPLDPSRNATRRHHHRRVSSTKVFLEWAQETSVRDLYGVCPPADLPDEVAFEGEREEWAWRNSSRFLRSSFSFDDKGASNHGINNDGSTFESLRQPILPTRDEEDCESRSFLLGESILETKSK
mmetsp:Transcript_13273/g.19518  ORF Transcript_13273/g.19518 Transcript_13273/m.19518 type:complete len:514 (-) Transcript_13273:113-1654(-)